MLMLAHLAVALSATTYVSTQSEIEERVDQLNPTDIILLTDDILLTSPIVFSSFDQDFTIKSELGSDGRPHTLSGNFAEPLLTFNAPATATQLRLENDHAEGELLQFNDDATVEGILSCGGGTSAVAIGVGGIATVKGVVLEGLTGGGTAFEFASSADVSQVTVSGSIATSFSGDITVLVSDSVYGGGTDSVSLTRSFVHNGTIIDASVPTAWPCPNASRPAANWTEWPVGESAPGGFVNDGVSVFPFAGWDDIDSDGAPYGPDADPNHDCDDEDPLRAPAHPEVCDDYDNDCDDFIDAADPNIVGATTVYPDADGDQFGDENADGFVTCDLPTGAVTTNDDCDDIDPSIHPGAEEIDDDGIDQDCDGVDGTVESDTDTDADTDSDTDSDTDVDADTDVDTDTDTDTDTTADTATAFAATDGCTCGPPASTSEWLPSLLTSLRRR